MISAAIAFVVMAGQRKVSIPFHAGKNIPIGTLKGILEYAKITPEMLRKGLWLSTFPYVNAAKYHRSCEA